MDIVQNATAATATLGRLRHAELPPEAEAVRTEVRKFLTAALEHGDFVPRNDGWHSSFDPSFSKELGKRGWIGMSWSKEYGGHDRPALERFVVLEELLAAGAPAAAHWIADRQSGPQIFKYGTEQARRELLPVIASGDCFISIGMSEPNSGSDLASIRTRARPVEGGWLLTGTKVWTSHALGSHLATVLCRTEAPGERRQDGMTVLIVDLAAPGVERRPIRSLTGRAHFAEMIFDDVFVPEHMLIGKAGYGWQLVTSELSLERSGPERVLSTFPLLRELVSRVAGDERAAGAVGALVAELWTLRRLSLAVAANIDAGQDPVVEAALVKDLGTRFEGRVIDVARSLVPSEPYAESADGFVAALAAAMLARPGFTIRGGTTEILRGIVARGAGGRS